MDDKKSFVLYTDLRGPLEFLSDEECGRLFRAIMDYADSGSVPAFTGALGMGFAFVRAQLDRNDEKWQQTRAKRSEAGRAGARARAAAVQDEPDQTSSAEQNKQTLDLLDSDKQTATNQAVNGPVPVSVPVNGPVPVSVPEPVPVRDGAFARFWAAYPRKEGKKDAREAFAGVHVDTDVLLQALERQKRSDRWKKDGGRYVPSAASWLRGARWEDEPPPSSDGFIRAGDAFSPMMLEDVRRLMRERGP